MSKYILVIVVCFTTQDIKNNVCWGVCRYDGYDTGSYNPKHDTCICGNEKRFSVVTDKTIKVVPRRPKPGDDDYYE